jgi:hypothetical protein
VEVLKTDKTIVYLIRSMVDRFMTHINRPIDVNECWEWTGYKVRGYGWCRFNKKSDFAHRVAFRIWKGEISQQMVIRHRCRNKCVNPAHLDIGTYADNMQDMIRDGTSQQGTRNTNAVLTEDDVREIRRRRSTGEKLLPIATSFNVKMNTISRICTRLTWKNI